MKTPGVGDGQGGLACCDSWSRNESDPTERLDWTGLCFTVRAGAGWGKDMLNIRHKTSYTEDVFFVCLGLKSKRSWSGDLDLNAIFEWDFWMSSWASKCILLLEERTFLWSRRGDYGKLIFINNSVFPFCHCQASPGSVQCLTSLTLSFSMWLSSKLRENVMVAPLSLAHASYISIFRHENSMC